MATQEISWLSARKEWQDRNASLLIGKRNWMFGAFGGMLTTALAIAVIGYLVTRPAPKPSIVLATAEGLPVPGGLMRSFTSSDMDNARRGVVVNFINNLRTVTGDVELQRKHVLQVYDFISSNSAAKAFADHFYTKGISPIERAETELVYVDVDSVIPITADTFQVEWQETIRDSHGGFKSTENWRANITLVVSPPNDEAAALKNPHGLFVTNIAWQKVK